MHVWMLCSWLMTAHRCSIATRLSCVCAGVHLCMWGSVEPANASALDMTLGFPAETLTWAGLKGVPEDGMLTVAVTGTADKPKIDWQG